MVNLTRVIIVFDICFLLSNLTEFNEAECSLCAHLVYAGLQDLRQVSGLI